MPLLLLTAISNLDFNFCVLGFDNLQPTSSARVSLYIKVVRKYSIKIPSRVGRIVGLLKVDGFEVAFKHSSSL